MGADLKKMKADNFGDCGGPRRWRLRDGLNEEEECQRISCAVETLNEKRNEVAPEVIDALMNLVRDFQESKAWNYEAMMEILSNVHVSDFHCLFWFMRKFMSENDVAGFLLCPGVDSLLVKKFRETFADCPDATVLFLEFLAQVFHTCAGVHQKLLATELYSFPLDVLQQMSGDVLVFVDCMDRERMESEVVSKCLHVIGGFYDFDSRLVEEQVCETCMAFLGSWRSGNFGIRMTGVKGLEKAMERHLGFVLQSVPMIEICRGVSLLLKDECEEIQIHGLGICRHVAKFADKRYAQQLLSLGVLDIELDNKTDPFLTALFETMYEFAPHDGELVEMTLQSRAALEGIAYLQDSSYHVRHAAFLFYVHILNYPQAIPFVSSFGQALLYIVDIVENADTDCVSMFLNAFHSYLCYCQEIPAHFDSDLVQSLLPKLAALASQSDAAEITSQITEQLASFTA